MNSMIEKRLSRFTRFAPVAAGLAAVANFSHAAMDTAAITSALTDAGAAVAVVGAAVLVVYVGMKAFKLVRGAL